MNTHRISTTTPTEFITWLDTWRGTLSRSAAIRLLLWQIMRFHRDQVLPSNHWTPNNDSGAIVAQFQRNHR